MRLLVALLLAFAAAAQGTPVSYPEVRPGPLAFPQDHGAHPDYRIEWWYVTGWLDTRSGPVGFQVTFFRIRPPRASDNPSAFNPRQLVFAHAALADAGAGRLRRAERSARAGLGLAGVESGRTRAWIGDWLLEQANGRYRARVEAGDWGLQLAFIPTQPPLLHGSAGFSRKGPNPREASHYYSQPQLRVEGLLRRDGRSEAVSGRAWLDHEWSSRYLSPQAVGWDWTGLNLADGGALMAFRIRDRSGATLWAGGTHREADGHVRAFAPHEIAWQPLRQWRSPRTGVEYPVAWRLALPGLTLRLAPLMDDQEMDARASTRTLYWEGAVRALDARSGRELGRGYLELTGYGGDMDL